MFVGRLDPGARYVVDIIEEALVAQAKSRGRTTIHVLMDAGQAGRLFNLDSAVPVADRRDGPVERYEFEPAQGGQVDLQFGSSSDDLVSIIGTPRSMLCVLAPAELCADGAELYRVLRIEKQLMPEAALETVRAVLSAPSLCRSSS